jgi:predicted kinase
MTSFLLFSAVPVPSHKVTDVNELIRLLGKRPHQGQSQTTTTKNGAKGRQQEAVEKKDSITQTHLESLFERLVEGPMTLWEAWRFLYDRMTTKTYIDMNVRTYKLCVYLYMLL